MAMPDLRSVKPPTQNRLTAFAGPFAAMSVVGPVRNSDLSYAQYLRNLLSSPQQAIGSLSRYG